MRFGLALAALAVAFVASAPARAFTVSSAIADGCHERITEDALRAARAALPATAKTLAPTDEERAFIDDLPFSLPADMRDLAAASLLVGVRDNDLKGRSPTQVDELAAVHGDPAAQQEHCLRTPGDVEPGGSAAALARCASFVHDRAASAIAALDATGAPDPNVRQDIAVWLSLRHGVTLSLPAFWVRIGQAMHALQDSFAHSFRTADGMHPTVVLDWVDYVDGTLDPAVDGPAHRAQLDRCDDDDPLRTRNRTLATQASTELLEAALDPSLDAAAKSTAVDAVVAKYTSLSPGCTAQNAWCDAPENAYATGCACEASGGRAGLVGFVALAGLALVALVRRRRRAHVAGAFAALLAFGVGTARADPNPPREREPRFGVAASLEGSFADPAAAQSLGIRVALARHLILGLDGELNEWIGVNGGRVEPGAANVYASAILRFPLVYVPLNLRTTLQLGTSIELADLYGVPSGSVGIFGGIYPLGLEWRLGRHAFLVFDPLGLAVPAPHLVGVPYAYPQFRTKVGVEITL